MFNIDNFVKRVEEVARTNKSAYVMLAHLEYVALEDELLKKTFVYFLGSEKYDDLVSKLKKKISDSKKIDNYTYEKYEGKYPINAAYNVHVIMRDKLPMIAASKFVCGNYQIPHIFLALISEEESAIASTLKENDVELDDFYANLVNTVTSETGITPSEDYSIEDRVCAALGIERENTQSPGAWHKYCIDYTEKAKEYKKPFIGREDIIDRTIQVLCRMDKSNPIHVGEPGVGKTAITIGLAKKIVENDVPDQIKDYKVYGVDLASMIAGTKFRGEFENRLTNLLKGAQEEGKCILFFDEIHTVVGAGAGSDSTMDASNILKPYLTDGNIKFIGATTRKEFKQIEKDSALMRRFQKVDVEEPSIEDSIKILEGLKTAYEEYHKVVYTKEAIEEAVRLTAEHVNDRFLPDKAIDIIDEAGAYKSIHFEAGAKVTEEDVREVISVLCKIPKKTFDKNEFKAIATLDETLKKKIYGQDAAIEALVKAVKLSKSGLGDNDKPIGSFIFMGPTGTGKTELARQLASALNIGFVKFDMSEYAEEHSVSKLFGTSAGYVGYEDGGLLVEAIRNTPSCVLLLDEFEKAHPKVANTFLQVLSDAKLTDNKGRVADFKNVIVIMTSNIGARDAYSHKSLGFTTENKTSVDTSIMNAALKQYFAPEFLNRITNVVEFNQIDETIGMKIVEKELKLLDTKLSLKGIKAKYTDECKKALIKKGISPEYGAREIQRIIGSEIKEKFVDYIFTNPGKKNYVVDYVDDKFVVNAQNTIKENTVSMV